MKPQAAGGSGAAAGAAGANEAYMEPSGAEPAWAVSIRHLTRERLF